ncbi:RsmB/NOP family class I SAM-dependent RNA methyltransferase [Mesorhizobium sp. M3A.F.Ca.ET.174.01.1.1]|uniref:RsmB/NOP family class I SAM-dependent RNA methyltransferase n=1 Tax=unclassified Mesorhizobium TaxID=325217 RepID=UPI0010937FB7|nr:MULTISPECIES: RsmB/NOP family class I SAM-dependent RNA methyltransferase [unclassified Mesorhizobium]TGS64042.1 RsmB/NOP family class I SAM-dependent RNA methyltransferase [Mesorhizobium sp. M3A.F.Ca.ET.201.01.1.1]TGS82227.1 RsmB/NOP family class I SAM-dependent RNA methyltransferase [Mesorhizobium sp. M3A.F.Ca.ET.175.01.1.1]TGT22034.1 RsmB/NOP family class I SAM-dependent RNA methyltransferase [Mesorhizobium sp. M3A.F.Ca.ET.174.01.1.1]
MRLGGRLAAAIEVLEDIGRRHRPVADALRDWGLSHRFAGGGDRAAIGNIVYDALRRKRSAGWLFGEDTPRAIGFGALLLEWGQTAQSLNDALDGDKFAPPLLSAAELKAVARQSSQEAPDAVRADVPDWCAPLLARVYGDAWIGEGAALAMRPPLDLRVNTLQSDRDRVLAELQGTGAAPAAIAPLGIRIPPIDGDGRHPNVQAEPAFQKGWFEVQDEGSQIAAALAGAEPGMQVLDYCAGAGGKTLALSAEMDNRGQLFAHDAEKVRLAPIFDRIRRAHSRNIQVVRKPADLVPLAGHMDLVLIDAPCTGSGTWRRRPDAKWRLTERQLEARKAEQQAILDRAQTFVKTGGLLVYITCSVFDAENGEQIAAFRERYGNFVPVDHRQLWDGSFPGHEGAARIADSGGISLSPALSGTDGFYFHALRKVG